MLARCFMVITFLAVSTCPGISGRPNVRVDGHPQAVVTIKCGDGGKAGVVVYWHTPFGPFHSPGLHTELNPVHVRQFGSLVLHNLSDLHQGLYYCLLQHDDGGSTLFPYELHVQAKDGERGPRFRRALRKQEAVSDEVFVAAVTTAVLLTFVFGFSAGALSRTPLLRCLRAITKRRRTPRQRRPDITMTTLTNCPSSPSSPSSSSSLCPPAKPQRSFRDKRSQDEKGEDNPAATYLETCDHVDDEKGRIALGGGSKGEEGRRWSSMKEKKEVHEVPAYDGMMEKNEKEQNEDDRKNRNDEDKRKNRREDGDENIISQSSQSDNDNQNQEVESFPRPRLSRVIRVYQYDQDGRRYSHLPDPEPGPTARTKQRSISLSRLNAIMDAASAGPMDTPPLPKDTL